MKPSHKKAHKGMIEQVYLQIPKTPSLMQSRSRNARRLLDRQLRLQTDDIRQSVREQMANLSVHRRDSTKDKAANREQRDLKNARDLEDFCAEAIMIGHVFQQTCAAHFILAHAEAYVVVFRVQVEVAHH